jgi:hypothetical protein
LAWPFLERNFFPMDRLLVIPLCFQKPEPIVLKKTKGRINIWQTFPQDMSQIVDHILGRIGLLMPIRLIPTARLFCPVGVLKP